MDQEIENIHIAISQSGAEDTANSIENLTSILKRLKTAMNMEKAAGKFSAAESKLEELKTTINGIDSDAVDRLAKLKDALNFKNGKGGENTAKSLQLIREQLQMFDDSLVTKMQKVANAAWHLSQAKALKLPKEKTPKPTQTAAPATAGDYFATLFGFKPLESNGAQANLKPANGYWDQMIGKLKEANKSGSNFFMMFKKRLFYRAINAVISLIVNGFKEGVNNFDAWSKKMGTDFHRKMNLLRADALYLKNSLGAMVAPLIEILTPALDRLTDQLVDVLNTINRIFARLNNQDIWTKAVKQTNKEYSKLKATILGFDELNIMNGDNNGSSAYDFKEVLFSDHETPTLLQDMEKILGVAATIGAVIAGWKVTGNLAKMLSMATSGVGDSSLGLKITVGLGGFASSLVGYQDAWENGANLKNAFGAIGGDIALGAAVGGVPGAIIGAIVGAIAYGVEYMIREWETVFVPFFDGLAEKLGIDKPTPYRQEYEGKGTPQWDSKEDAYSAYINDHPGIAITPNGTYDTSPQAEGQTSLGLGLGITNGLLQGILSATESAKKVSVSSSAIIDGFDATARRYGFQA